MYEETDFPSESTRDKIIVLGTCKYIVSRANNDNCKLLISRYKRSLVVIIGKANK